MDGGKQGPGSLSLKERKLGGYLSNTLHHQQSRSWLTQTTQMCAFASLIPFAFPDKGSQMRIPTRHGLFQPVNDLLGGLGMLTGEGIMDNGALHRLGHIQPGA